MPKSLKVLELCGSLRRHSYNRAVLRAAQALVPAAGMQIEAASPALSPTRGAPP